MDPRLRNALLWISAVLVVLLSGHHYVLPYAVALALMLVVLGFAPAYRLAPDRARYDGLFVLYLWLIVAVRCRPFRWSPPVEAALNMLEHLGFALVIGLMAYLLFHLVMRWPARRALIAAVIAFNVLGFANELFQNLMNGRAAWPLQGDAWKDIAVNALGSTVLVLLMRKRLARS